MKYVNILCLFLLLSVAAASQSNTEKQRLLRTVDSFFAIYNTGDSTTYARLLEKALPAGNERDELVKRYVFTFSIIGKVDVRRVDVVSSKQADIWAKDRQFDSWWKFTVFTDSLQHFSSRLVKPERFNGAFVQAGHLTEKQVGATLDDYISHRLGTNFSGNVFISNGNHVLFSKSYGLNAAGQPNTSSQAFGLASAGKMFTAISVLQLQEKNRLILKDTVGKYLPSLHNKALKSLTLEQLLTHTSGLGDFFESPLYNRIKDSIKTAKDMLPVIEESTLSFEPGKSWQYSNTGFSLLGLLVETITGTSFETYVQNEILSPLGMMHTTPGGGAGGGQSTIEDMAAFSSALMGNKLLSPSSTKLLLQYTSLNKEYGLGTEHYQLGAEHIVGHSGGFINECTEINLYTKQGYTVIILSNSNPPFGHFISDKIKELLVRKG